MEVAVAVLAGREDIDAKGDEIDAAAPKTRGTIAEVALMVLEVVAFQLGYGTVNAVAVGIVYVTTGKVGI